MEASFSRGNKIEPKIAPNRAREGRSSANDYNFNKFRDFPLSRLD